MVTIKSLSLVFKFIRQYVFLFLVPITFFSSSCKTAKISQSREVLSTLNPYLHYYEGVLNRLYGNFNGAIASLEKSISADPNSSAPYYELALCYTNLNDIKKSIHYIERAVRIDSTNQYYLSFIVSLYISDNQIENAIEYQKKLIDIDSTSLQNHLHLALLYSQLSQFDKAIKIFTNLSQNYGFIPKVSESLARIYYEKGLIDDALIELSELVSNVPDNPFYLLFLSDLYFQKGYDSIGFSNIYHALEIDSDFPFAHFELYQRYKDDGNIGKSLSKLTYIFKNKNFDVNEKVQLFYPLLHEPLYYTAYPLKLDTLVSTLISNHPNDIVVYDLAYEHLLRRRDFRSARVVLEKLLSLDPTNLQRWEMAISMDYSLEDFAQSISKSNQAISLFPNHFMFYIYASISYQKLNSINEAIHILNLGYKNVESNEYKSEILGSLGDLYYQYEQKGLAFKTYSKCLKYNPENARILNNFSYYLSLEKSKLRNALQMSSKAVDLEPNNSTYIDTKGWVLFQMGRYEEARDVLRNAVSKNGSTSAAILEHYADALYKTGNKESAYIYWLKANEIGGGSENLQKKINQKKYVP